MENGGSGRERKSKMKLKTFCTTTTKQKYVKMSMRAGIPRSRGVFILLFQQIIFRWNRWTAFKSQLNHPQSAFQLIIIDWKHFNEKEIASAATVHDDQWTVEQVMAPVHHHHHLSTRHNGIKVFFVLVTVQFHGNNGKMMEHLWTESLNMLCRVCVCVWDSISSKTASGKID